MTQNEDMLGMFHCDKCGWEGRDPPIFDGGAFGALEVCPKCNWTYRGMFHTDAPWRVLSRMWDEEDYPEIYDVDD